MEDIKSTTDQNVLGNLRAILYLLQTHLEEFKDEVDRSYALLQVGEMTELSKHIEETLNNPFENVYQVSSNIDEQVKYIVDKFVKSFLRFNKSIIHTAFRSTTILNDLHYSIVLQEDNIENRSRIFEFLDKFDSQDIATRYPVYIQFVPVELMDKVKFNEEIKLD